MPQFIITSLPRCGSTSLARLLNRHESVRCLIEPFHPQRYGGRFHRLAIEHSLQRALAEILGSWNAIKHVWEASGWPFSGKADLNNELLLQPGWAVVLLVRRNLLKRFVSTYISRNTKYWIGSREEFLHRLSTANLLPLNAERVRAQLQRDAAAVADCRSTLQSHGVTPMILYYEDFFGENVADHARLNLIQELLRFLQLKPISGEEYERQWKECLDPAQHRWSSPEVYRNISNIEEIETRVGCEETGWLFK